MRTGNIDNLVKNEYDNAVSLKQRISKADEAKSPALSNEKNVEEKAESKKEDLKSKVFGDVISASEDGDVVNAKKESMKKLDDGFVFPKNAEKVIKDEREKDDEEVESLAGYSENEIELLYEQGKISKIKYDREIERREEITGEDKKETADETKDASRVEEIKKEQDKDEQLFKKLGGTVKNMADERIKADAYEAAVKNDRTDIFADVFGQNN